jgi:hypothetical protein
MVCEWFDLKTTRTVFAGLASKSVATVSGGLASEPAATVFFGLASKPVTMIFSRLALKLVAMIFLGLALKLAADFLVEPQNQDGGEFPCLDLKIGSTDLVILASKSPQWFLGLGLRTKQTSVYRLRHKPTEGSHCGTHIEI